MSVEDVVDAVADADRDPDTVRRSLDPFTDDGALSTAAIEAAVSDTSQILATAETRVDLAARAYEDARTAAADAPDLDVVEVRLEAFGHRLGDLKAHTAGIGAAIEPPERVDDPEAVYRSATDLREAAAEAQRVVRVADDLADDLGAFESWLGSADRRHEVLAADVEAIEESLGELSAAGSLDSPDASPSTRADATVQAALLELFVADLRAEAADLRVWADRESAAFPPSLPRRIDAAERRVRTLSDRFDGVDAGDPDRIEDAETALRTLAGFDPPVVWDRVRAALADTPYGDPKDRDRLTRNRS